MASETTTAEQQQQQQEPIPPPSAEVAKRAAPPPPATQDKKVPVTLGVEVSGLDEAWRLAQIMSKSLIVPKDFQGQPENILVAIQMGAEIGLKPMQALQSIAVINGRPSIWGDGFLALIMGSPLYEDHDEYYEVDGERRDALAAEDLKKPSSAAVCVFRRHGKLTPVIRKFSVAQAQKAGLINDTKRQPWQNYPDRMLSMRARSWAGRDAFPDLLRGIRTAEEARDQEPTVIETQAVTVQRISETPKPATPSTPSAAAPAAVQTAEGAPSNGPVPVGPSAVAAVDQAENVESLFVVTLANGQAFVLTDAADAMQLEMLKGTSKQITAVALPSPDGKVLNLQSFTVVA